MNAKIKKTIAITIAAIMIFGLFSSIIITFSSM